MKREDPLKYTPELKGWIGHCRKCGVRVPVNQIRDWGNPLCVQCMANAGGGNDPETTRGE